MTALPVSSSSRAGVLKEEVPGRMSWVWKTFAHSAGLDRSYFPPSPNSLLALDNYPISCGLDIRLPTDRVPWFRASSWVRTNRGIALRAKRIGSYLADHRGR